MVEVLVEHDYVAKEPNELTITKGDIIKDVTRKQGGWWEGTLKDRKGLFPDNFVTVIDKDSAVVLRNRKDASRIRQCRVVFSYKQDHEDELNLNVGDVIDILGEEEEGWWRGVLHGKTGVFPSNFVEEITPVPSKHASRENLAAINDPAPPLFAKPAKILCEVKYAYKAQNEDELSLKEGDLVTLLSKDGQDPGWWKGELNGLVGVFPDNFVTLLPIIEELTPNFIKEDKRKSPQIDPFPTKPPAVSIQRKSTETHNHEEALASTRTTPPLPGKKPIIPVKKSPSSSGTTGIFYGLKKKIVDKVDGIASSKAVSPPKTETNDGNTSGDNAFDDVHRRPLLSDPRASRPKAPGRRPPSAVGKDPEPGIMNGNSDHLMETLSETPPLPALNSSTDSDTADGKPKLREWEKHRAPWLEEMKLNQAKRTSTGPEPKPKLTPTPTDKPISEIDSSVKEPSTVDKSKSIGLRLKTSPNESAIIRNKQTVPIAVRPQTIQNVSDVYLKKPSKIEVEVEENPPKPLDLEERIAKLEDLFEKQQKSFEAAIEELKGKLQIERELRMQLQVKLERFTTEQI